MAKQPIKHIAVSESTHSLAKTRAAVNQMTLKEYIKMIVNTEAEL